MLYVPCKATQISIKLVCLIYKSVITSTAVSGPILSEAGFGGLSLKRGIGESKKSGNGNGERGTGNL